MNTSKLLALGALFTFSTVATAQSTMLTALVQPDSLVHQELGEINAEDYAAHPYGKGHLLFLRRAAVLPQPQRIHKRMRLLHVPTSCD
jgi:hypothetical protein